MKNIIIIEGKGFIDLNKNGILDAYEDWRLPVEEKTYQLS